MLGKTRLERAAGVGLVAILHLAFFELLTWPQPTHGPERGAVLVDVGAASIRSGSPPFVQLEKPEQVNVPPPDVVIGPIEKALGVGPSALVTTGPRIDPTYLNALPSIPEEIRGQKIEAVVLRVLIGVNGQIIDANVAKSSGIASLDGDAIEFVRAHWRFLPAMIGGEVVQVWTTVSVQFQGG